MYIDSIWYNPTIKKAMLLSLPFSNVYFNSYSLFFLLTFISWRSFMDLPMLCKR